MLSATRLDPDLSAEIFLLSEAPTTERVDEVQAWARGSWSEAHAVRAEARQARVKHQTLHKSTA